MTWSRDEAEAAVYEERAGYMVETRCEKCGKTAEVHYEDGGTPTHYYALVCDCGGEREPV